MKKHAYVAYPDGDLEVAPQDLITTDFTYLAIRCINPLMKNMSDAELAEDDKKFNGDGRELKFNIFVNDNICLSFNFNLFGLDLSTTFSRDAVGEPVALQPIFKVIEVVQAYFADKTLETLSEVFYERFQREILDMILIASVKV